VSTRSLRRLVAGASLGLLGLGAIAPAGAGQTTRPARTHVRPPAARPPPAPSAGDVLLDVPYIAQTEALCGGAAVTMSLRFWGETRVRPEAFSGWLTPDGAGIRTTDLQRATAALGWKALALTGDLGALRTHLARGRPLVALLEVGAGRHHYVTVVGRVGGRIVFHDPAVSPYRSMSEAEFLEAWSGGAFWTMLVLPHPAGVPRPDGGAESEDPPTRHAETAPGDEPFAAPPPRDGPVADPRVGPAVATAGEEPRRARCRADVARGVRLARGGSFEAADGILRSASGTCPDDPVALRELAALRLRQGRPDDATRLARAAAARDPRDRHTRELLAASHYLAGDDLAALAEWSRLEPIILDEVTLGGTTRTRNRPILALTGLEPGRALGAGALSVGRKRLALLPAAASTRLSYRPLDDGGIIVTASVAERSAVPSPTRLLAEGALGLFTDRSIRLRSASPLGHGELWGLEWRWREPRRRVRISLALPVRSPLPAVLTIAGLAARETYAFGTEAREERRRAEVGMGTWATPWLRTSITVGLDRWRDLGSFGSVGLETRIAGLDDRVGVTVDGELWAPMGGARTFAAGGAGLDWTSRHERRGVVASARLGGRLATDAAPRSIWPGAGSGSGRAVRARAHDLLTDGRITGPLFGRRLAYGGLEAVRWAGVGPLDVGLAAFVDVAAAGARPEGIRGAGFQTDLGLGLRIGLPGGSALRLDVGRGLLDGETAVSAGIALDGDA